MMNWNERYADADRLKPMTADDPRHGTPEGAKAEIAQGLELCPRCDKALRLLDRRQKREKRREHKQKRTRFVQDGRPERTRKQDRQQRRISHLNSGHDKDLETLTGHLISEHGYPQENMLNLLRDYGGKMDSPGVTSPTPLPRVFQEILDYHDTLHREDK